MADMFNLMPFSLIEISSSNGLKYISPSLAFENASVSQIGSRTYLGIKCYLESITPPANQNSNNVKIDECISASTGLPLTVTAYQNGNVMLQDNVSSINSAPAGISQITAIP